MKSSSIALLTPKNVTESDQKFVINVIDSPAHMDFEFEVKIVKIKSFCEPVKKIRC